MRLQRDLDHEFRQGEPFDLQPGSGRKLLRVDRVTIPSDCKKLCHIGRKDVLNDHVIDSIALVLQNLVQIGVSVLHLLLQIADSRRIAFIIHAHGARDLDVITDLNGMRVAESLFDLRSQKEILRRFSCGLRLIRQHNRILTGRSCGQAVIHIAVKSML